MEEIELADQVGLDVFGVGEHHRPDFAVSAPAVVLAAAAERTKRIRLTSAVTVLSSDDPVRVFQDFATLDLLSGGRAEIMAGRGSFIESFPLFGYDLDDYDELFAEKLELLLQLRDVERVTWSGGTARRSTTSASTRARCRSRCRSGSPSAAHPESAVARRRARAADGARDHRRPAGAVRAVRRAPPRGRASEAGHEPPAAEHQLARLSSPRRRSRRPTEFFPPYAAMMNAIGRERGWPPIAAAGLRRAATLRGALFVGSPEEVVEKILFQHEIFGHQRFLAQMSVGTMPHDKVLRSIELFGTEVAPGRSLRPPLGGFRRPRRCQ